MKKLLNFKKYFENVNTNLPMPDSDIVNNIQTICNKLSKHLENDPKLINEDEYLHKFNIKYITYDEYKVLAKKYNWAIPTRFNFFGYINDHDNSISFTVMNDKSSNISPLMLELLITHESLHATQKINHPDLNTKLIEPSNNLNQYLNQWFEIEAYAYNIAYMNKKKNFPIEQAFAGIFQGKSIESVYSGENLTKFNNYIKQYLEMI